MTDKTYFTLCTALLGRVAVCTAKEAYSRQTFPVTICRSVCVSVQCIVENGGLDPNAVWHGRSDGSMDEALWGSVNGKG